MEESANGLCGKESRTETLGVLGICEIVSSSIAELLIHTEIIKLFCSWLTKAEGGGLGCIVI